VPIIRIFFQRGAFDAVSTEMTALALLFYSVGLWAFSANRVMISAFYAFQDTKTPVKVAAVALVANGALSLLLMGPMKHGGLALAVSVASGLQFCLLVLLLHKKGGIFDWRPVVECVLRSVVASLLMGVVIFYLNEVWGNRLASASFLAAAAELAVITMIGGVVFFITARALHCSELSSIAGLFRPMLRKLDKS
jgi:putative peptidoglycan lipid II flippase